jgi:hypothetical protein
MQTAKSQWKKLYGAFRAAERKLWMDPWAVIPHGDVTAALVIAKVVEPDHDRAGFALRHGSNLSRTLYGARTMVRTMSSKLNNRLFFARLDGKIR